MLTERTRHARYPGFLRRALYQRGLAGNIVPAGGAYVRPAIRPAAYYEPWGIQFVWDLPYSALAVARVGGRADLARGFVENMLDFAAPHGPDAGMLPRSVARAGDQPEQDGSQTPLLAWLTTQLDELEPDRGFLERTYPRLAAFVDWWQSPRRDVDRDGLSEYAGSTPVLAAFESGHDFSPERDILMAQPTPAGADGLVHEPIADVFLNACLHAELDALARIADRIDAPQAARWRARRDALAQRMHEAMWDAEVGGFFPVVRRDLCASQPRVVRHTPAMLMPLWAGIATAEQATQTVATLLGRRRDYPRYDGVLSVRLDGDALDGYRIVTDALHPTRGAGRSAGGAEVTDRSVSMRFADDRGPAAAAFTRVDVAVGVSPQRADDATVVAVVEDGTGRVHRPIDGVIAAGDLVVGTVGLDPTQTDGRIPWVRGLRRVEVTAHGCTLRNVDIRYGRMDTSGLLSPYGIKSAHPLDGKHPAPGAPTEFWSGTVWGPHSLHGCHALRRHGHEDLARACAQAFCDATALSYAAGGDAFEHLSHENGRGLGTGGYTWGAAVALMLMQDFLDEEAD